MNLKAYGFSSGKGRRSGERKILFFFKVATIVIEVYPVSSLSKLCLLFHGIGEGALCNLSLFAEL